MARKIRDPGMLTVRQQLQVFRSVVGLDLIDVVNIFVGEELPANLALHDEAVLLYGPLPLGCKNTALDVAPAVEPPRFKFGVVTAILLASAWHGAIGARGVFGIKLRTTLCARAQCVFPIAPTPAVQQSILLRLSCGHGSSP